MVERTAVEVSVVMPAYNAQRYIAATIESVLAQTFEDFELIVVDDCSKDGTADIVREFASRDERVSLIQLSENRGAPAGPRNIGVRAAKGRWIAFLDADDLWHPRKLELQLKVLRQTGAQFCSSQMVDFKDERAVEFVDPPDPVPFEKIGFLKQLVKFRTPTSSVVLSRELALRHPFNEDIRFKAREDLDCWLHCHEEIRWSVKLEVPLMAYRIIPGQISGKKWEMVRRHYHVLKQYRFRSGRSLGIGAAVFTATHFLLALLYLRARRGL
jgi:teichuronic acid biosynthesis glycosyltransferase TuaG